ncbi:hypothetical protein HYH03_004331 [Edaphochlamys debaryana]|uniref:Origin recognition complex subunit 2 n=1 Tax=Edaphochlamys debaryana TaxID=47281 RepID=A0A835YF15_9CHLO|nr:hypothetical protein HYH03_004331 [Edaphochlamys debaryana]|eukprot:KAG2497585.1 hypothetical protein HYH03_004331 [Edaphochlamys debaryana]
MAPRGQAASAPAPTRPRRAAAQKARALRQCEESDDDQPSSSASEEEQQERPTTRSGRPVRATAKASAGKATAAAAGPSSRRATKTTKEVVSLVSDSDGKDGSGSDGSGSDEEATPAANSRRATAKSPAAPAAGRRGKAASGTAAKPVPAATATRRGRKAAAATAKEDDASGSSADEEDDDDECEEMEAEQEQQQQHRRGAGRPRGRPAAAAKPAAASAAAEPSSSDDDDDESDEEEEEEAQEEAAAAGPSRAPARGRGARKAPGPVAPTALESRKRLFDLLERRVGGQAGGAEGARLTYGELPPKNPNKKACLASGLRGQFDDWHSRLRSNFSVLLYGFGSKRALLEEFARTLAGSRNRGDAAVLVFHGYNPRCTAREVVAGVAGALMQRSFRNLGSGASAAAAAAGTCAASGAASTAAVGGVGGGAPGALRSLVEDIRAEPPGRHAFVVIHNIDGPGLRADMSLLSALAACPQVHVIASVDHCMAPLLWDAADAARFRWQYINATTFLPYTAEISGAPSVLVGAFKSGVVTAGAGTVLRSLVLGAQEVFRLLAEHLLEDEESEGVAFAHLYRMCRERFLVRDERVLRQHLVEFVDHQLVRLRPASDNSGELLAIPMPRSDIRAVLDDLMAARGE